MNSIRKLRLHRGMTQKEFGDIIGVKQQTVCKYEGKNSNVSLSVLQKISDKFDIPVEELLEDKIDHYISTGSRKNAINEIKANIIARVKRLNSHKLKKLLEFLSILDEDWKDNGQWDGKILNFNDVL